MQPPKSVLVIPPFTFLVLEVDNTVTFFANALIEVFTFFIIKEFLIAIPYTTLSAESVVFDFPIYFKLSIVPKRRTHLKRKPSLIRILFFFKKRIWC